MKTSVTVLLFLSLFKMNFSLFRKHFYVDNNKNWDDAQQHCRQYYDDLSTVSGPELQTLSNDPKGTRYYSIGLRTDPSQLMWTWSEGGRATISEWESGEPNPNNRKCGYLKPSDSKVYDNDCTWHIAFLCMEVYELILVKQENTWEEALDYCRQHYIDLAILSSEEMMAEAKINSTEAQTDEVWTGLRFLAGHWFWVNGEDLQHKAWSVGGELQCPAMNQRCGVYHREETVWKPEDCEKKLNFLCVKRKYVNPT